LEGEKRRRKEGLDNVRKKGNVGAQKMRRKAVKEERHEAQRILGGRRLVQKTVNEKREFIK